MFNVLVLWSIVPERTNFVFLENIDEKTYNKLLRFNNEYANTSALTTEIVDFFYNSQGDFKFETLPGPMINIKLDAVIHTGLFRL